MVGPPTGADIWRSICGPGFTGYARSVAFAPDSVYDGVTFRTVSVTVTYASVPAVSMTTWFTNY